jgi:hypothetical protein
LCVVVRARTRKRACRRETHRAHACRARRAPPRRRSAAAPRRAAARSPRMAAPERGAKRVAGRCAGRQGRPGRRAAFVAQAAAAARQQRGRGHPLRLRFAVVDAAVPGVVVSVHVLSRAGTR